MMNQLTVIYAPKGDAEFMRLTREYYSLKYEEYDCITSYLTKIKTLEERIRSTNIILDDNKQTLLCLGITLPEHLQYFNKIWTVTPGMTADKTRNMLLEEERRTKAMPIESNGMAFAAVRPPGKRTMSRKAAEEAEEVLKCSKCGKNHLDKNC